MVRRWVAILLIFVVILFLRSCFGKKSEDPSVTEPTTEYIDPATTEPPAPIEN